MAQVTVFSGSERRRRWRDEEKRALVAAAFAPGASVADVARRADLQPGQIYRWRKELGRGEAVRPSGFAEVVIGSSERGPCSSFHTVVAVELGGAIVRVGAAAPERLVATILRALSR